MTPTLCPCGSQHPLTQCCLPIIEGTKIANTAEQLMRSRYSAYALGKASYIANSYATVKQADNSEADIQAWIEQTHWLQLVVEQCQTSDDRYHYVQFIARYLHQDELCEMQENSRFIKENGQWRYLDGNILRHDVIKRLKRNDTCPCGSDKKFKRCHG